MKMFGAFDGEDGVELGAVARQHHENEVERRLPHRVGDVVTAEPMGRGQSDERLEHAGAQQRAAKAESPWDDAEGEGEQTTGVP